MSYILLNCSFKREKKSKKDYRHWYRSYVGHLDPPKYIRIDKVSVLLTKLELLDVLEVY